MPDEMQMADESQKGLPFKPAEEFLISDFDTIKVIADPLRIQILEHMAEPRTVKQVAKELNIAPTKLYYHVNMLEEHGLLKVTDTRVVSGIIEKQYQIVAMRFKLADDLVSLMGPGHEDAIDAMLNSIFDLTKSDLKLSISAGLLDLNQPHSDPRTWQIGRSLVITTPERMVKFYKRFDELVKEFCNDDFASLQPDEQVYAMTFVMYPTTYNPKKEDEDEQSS